MASKSYHLETHRVLHSARTDGLSSLCSMLCVALQAINVNGRHMSRMETERKMEERQIGGKKREKKEARRKVNYLCMTLRKHFLTVSLFMAFADSKNWPRSRALLLRRITRGVSRTLDEPHRDIHGC